MQSRALEWVEVEPYDRSQKVTELVRTSKEATTLSNRAF